MIKAVLFDMDGVLIDSYDAWLHLLMQAGTQLGGPGVTPERFAESWGQGLQADIEAFFPHLDIDELARFYEDNFPQHAHRVREFPKAREVLNELERRKIPFAVITNTPASIAGSALAGAGLHVGVIVGGLDVDNAKPAPDMVLRACERLGVRADEVVVVGDSEYDEGAANSAGAHFIGRGDLEVEHRIECLDELLALLPQ